MMLSSRSTLFLCGILLAGLLANGCSDDDPTAPVTTPMPDFTMLDVNPTSASYDQGVSPRDYLQKVSAWYFGHST